MTENIFLADDDATMALGRRLAAALRPGDLVLLDGDLGAGKTALARAVIRTLVGDERLDVPSPSFALVQPYEANGHPILHADLYRLRGAHEVDELGLFDRAEVSVFGERFDEKVLAATERSAGIRFTVQFLAFILPFVLGIVSAWLGAAAMSRIETSQPRTSGNFHAVFAMMIGGFASVIAGCMLASVFLWPHLPSIYTR